MDIKLSSSGDMAIEKNDAVLLAGIDAIVQDVAIRLQVTMGEWRFDRRIGIPYGTEILGRKPYGERLIAIRGLLRDAALSADGMERLVNYETEFDSATRVFSVMFRGITVLGTFEYNREFII